MFPFISTCNCTYILCLSSNIYGRTLHQTSLFVYPPTILISFLKHPFSPLYWIISINIQTAYQIHLQSKIKQNSPDPPLLLPAAAISLFPL